MLLWCLFTYQVAFGGTATNLCSLFRGRKFLAEAAQKANGGSGSGRDTSQRRQPARTTQSFCLCQISVFFLVHSRICPRMHNIAVYIRTDILAIYNVTEALRILHFSAFIVLRHEFANLSIMHGTNACKLRRSREFPNSFKVGNSPQQCCV